MRGREDRWTRCQDIRLTLTHLFSRGPLKCHPSNIEILKPTGGPKADAVSASKSLLQPRKLSLVVSQIADSCAGPSGSPESKTGTTRGNGLQKANPQGAQTLRGACRGKRKTPGP